MTPSMAQTQHWEYLVVTVVDLTVLQDSLNRIGAVGWELVSTTTTDKKVGDVTGNEVVAVFKRRCAELPLPPFRVPEFYPDPTRRFDVRYWDGQHWSAHVANIGPPRTADVDPPTMLEPTLEA